MECKVRLNCKLFRYYALASFVEGLLAIVWISIIPTDTKNALFIGLSLPRLILLGVTCIGVVSIVTLLFVSFRYPFLNDLVYEWIEKRKLMRISLLSGSILLLINLVPKSEWGEWGAMFERFLPFNIWIGLVSLQWFFLCLIATKGFLKEMNGWMTSRIIHSRYSIVITMVILVIVYVLSVLVYPQAIKEDYWYETGVPILGWQIILSLFIGLIYNHFHEQIIIKLGRKTDLITFIIIFLLCGLLWSFTPLAHGFFNPGPFPPNNIQYPYSDAARFDLQAQSTLVGLGFDAGSPLDRPIYPLFLAMIHLISGQIFTNNMMLQAGLFGIFPALVYLICTELGSRIWGVFSASAISLWGWNAILSNRMLNTSNPKQMLTDFPMAIMLSLVIFVTLKWIKSGKNSGLYALLSGGMLSAAVYVRYSGLVLIPILLIIAINKHRPSYKKGLAEALLVIIGFLLFTSPWYTRNILAGQEMKIPFTNKILFVIKNRYQPIETQSTKWFITPGKSGNSIEPALSLTTEEQNNFSSSNNQNSPNSLPFLSWFTAHLIHNVMSSILILPTSLEIASLRTSLELGGQIWKPSWNGVLPATRVILLLFQFFILSLGITGIVRRDKVSAAIVIFTFMGVQTANAMGRTSGGRYIVPVDWLVVIVYFAGFLYLFGKLDSRVKSSEEKERNLTFNWKKMAITALFILIIGAIPVMYERISIALFHTEKKPLTFEMLKYLPGISFTAPELLDISQFLDQNNARLLSGPAFYPVKRQIQDMNIPSAIQKIGESTLLSFYFIQNGQNWTGYFPHKKKVDIQNQDEVIIIGCVHNNWVVVRDLIIVRSGRATQLISDFEIEKCDQLVKQK